MDDAGAPNNPPVAAESPGRDQPAPKELGPLGNLWHNWIKPILIVVGILVLFRTTIADWHDVPSGSMNPTIVEGDRIVVNKLAYDLKVPFTDHALLAWNEPERGDIVTFWTPEDRQRFVKRVVAVPGDTLELRNGRVYVNGEPADYDPIEREVSLLEPETDFRNETVDDRSWVVQYQNHRPQARSLPAFTVPEEHFFVMGDNRDNSTDSRAFGPVPQELIIGRAFGVAASFEDSFLRPRWSRWLTRMH